MKETEVENAKPAPDSLSPEATGPLLAVDPAPVSQEALEELKQRAAKADDHWDRLLRTTADFDNYKKRAAREKNEAIKFAHEALMQKLIPVLDNLDTALAAAQAAQTPSAQSLQTGITMVFQQLKGVLTEAGLEEIDAAGKKFDPNFHEAISQKETDRAPEGQVVEQVRKGYRLRDRLLRPASVVIAKSPAS
jgi:molecular chaperone GrpE